MRSCLCPLHCWSFSKFNLKNKARLTFNEIVPVSVVLLMWRWIWMQIFAIHWLPLPRYVHAKKGKLPIYVMDLVNWTGRLACLSLFSATFWIRVSTSIWNPVFTQSCFPHKETDSRSRVKQCERHDLANHIYRFRR